MPWAVAAAAVSAGGAIYSSKQQAKNPASMTQTNSIDPNIQNASNYALDRARTISGRAYTPFTGSRVAGLTGNETQAENLAGQYGSALSDQIRSGGPTGAQLSKFENPYLDQVLTNQRRVIGEEYGRQASALAANQSATDAFRTGRSDLARSRLEKNRMQALSDAEATGRAGAFDRAMANYFNNQQQQRGAFETAQQALGQTGLQHRAVNQAGLDTNYGSFLERRDWDVNNLGPLLNAVSVARGNTATNAGMNPGSPDYYGAAAGLIGAGLKSYGNYRKSQNEQQQQRLNSAITNANNSGPFQYPDSGGSFDTGSVDPYTAFGD